MQEDIVRSLGEVEPEVDAHETVPFDQEDCGTGEAEAGTDAAMDWRGSRFEGVIRHALAAGAGLKELREAAVETAIHIAMDEEEGNVQRAARRLGVTDRALQMRRASNRHDSPKPASVGAPRRSLRDLHTPALFPSAPDRSSTECAAAASGYLLHGRRRVLSKSE